MKAISKRSLGLVHRFFPEVKTLADAKRPLSVEVTPADQRGSRKKDPHSCAMARACKRAENMDGAIISVAVAYLVKGNHATRYVVPPAVAREIVSFDRHHDFAAGEYRLLAPRKGRSLGYRRSPHKGTAPKRGAMVHRTVGIRSLVVNAPSA